MSDATTGSQTHQRSIATFDRYEDAEAFVDRLSDTGFPVDRVAIVGRGVYTIEKVTGRLDGWRAAAYGALSGAILGSLFGLIFGGLFADDGGEFLATWLYWMVFGALWLAIFSVVAYAFMGGRRNFVSQFALRAGQYDVVVDESVADQAERWLSEHIAQRPLL
jgi:hypothetical protein